MGYVALGLALLLVLLLTLEYFRLHSTQKITLPDLEKQHEEERDHDVAESKTAEPVDFLRNGFDKLR